MDYETKKKRLASYVSLRTEVERLEARLYQLRSEAEMPAMKMGDGSKHTGGSGDRMARATVRLVEYEEEHGPEIKAAREKMNAIKAAIKALSDPLERSVLRMRYIDSDNSRLVKWNEVAAGIFGSDEEKNMRAVFRLHESAVNNIDLERVEL